MPPEKKYRNQTNYFTWSDPHHDMSGESCYLILKPTKTKKHQLLIFFWCCLGSFHDILLIDPCLSWEKNPTYQTLWEKPKGTLKVEKKHKHRKFYNGYHPFILFGLLFKKKKCINGIDFLSKYLDYIWDIYFFVWILNPGCLFVATRSKSEKWFASTYSQKR